MYKLSSLSLARNKVFLRITLRLWH